MEETNGTVGGWYVVMDQDECILFAAHYQDAKRRNQVETKVAENLVPGTWYAMGKTFEEAVEDAIWKVRIHGGRADVSPDTETGREVEDR